MRRPAFTSVQRYGRRFTDAVYWRPFVEAICQRHRLEPCREVRAGLPGTFPVFVVDDSYVVKLFGELFDGMRRHAVERELYRVLVDTPELAVPKMVATGRLFEDELPWSWPYIITTAVAGSSLGEVATSVTADDKLAVMEWTAAQLRLLHRLPIAGLRSLDPSWEEFVRLIGARRAGCAADHRRWASMPAHLIEQINSFLPPVDALIDRAARPCLIHGDVNEDHVLGGFHGRRWCPEALIDFGDAMVGDRIYELVALHIGLAHCDKGLLRTFLDAYGMDDNLRTQFVLRAMSMTLLHESNVLGQVFAEHPAAHSASSLEELAGWLWDLDTPGAG